MPEREARARAVYDHDNEEPRPSGRRRRQVADWGVGEELFDGMPGRRFDRRPHRELPREDIPRGDAADGRRTIVIETGNDELPLESLEPAEEEFASRDEAFRARERRRRAVGRRRAVCRRASRSPSPRSRSTRRSSTQPRRPLEAPTEEIVARHPGGSAHREDRRPPGGVLRAAGACRQRPPRTMHERLGPRPERIAAWAFALGLLLILIAIVTANA